MKLPDFYHFPPFFTIQPVLSTREKQLGQWRELILKYRECTAIMNHVPMGCTVLLSYLLFVTTYNINFIHQITHNLIKIIYRH